jgi:hypothetical protein
MSQGLKWSPFSPDTPAMKFPQLPLGARFEYEGKVYVKAGPVTASAEQGGQRLIPRYAVLKPLDGVVAQAMPGPGRKLDEAAVLAAFEEFYGACKSLVAETSHFELTAARQRFLTKLR